MRKRSNFVEKNDDCGDNDEKNKYINLKTKNEKEKHKIRAMHIAFHNCKQFVFLEKNKKKGTWRLGIYLVLVKVCVLFGCTLEKLTKYWNCKWLNAVIVIF